MTTNANLEDSLYAIEQARNLLSLAMEILWHAPNPKDEEYDTMAVAFCNRLDLLCSLICVIDDAMIKGYEMLVQEVYAK